MNSIISTVIMITTTLVSFALGLALTRLGLAAMFRLLPTARLPLRVIRGGRARLAISAPGL